MVNNPNIQIINNQHIIDLLINGYSVKIIFDSINKDDFIIKLNSYRGRQLYNYTSKNQSEIDNLKFNVEDGKTYYIWEGDKSSFEEMNAEQQLEYIKTQVIYEGINIGCIDSCEINDILYSNLIHTNVTYTFNIHDSNKYPYKWIKSSINDVEFSILANNFIKGKTIFRIAGEIIINNNDNININLKHKLNRIFNYFNSTNSKLIYTYKDGSPLGDRYIKTVGVYFIDDDIQCKLFDAYELNSLNGYRLIIDKDLTKKCNISKVDSRDCTSLEGIREFIQSLCNDFRESKNETYINMIRDLQGVFS